MSSAFVFAVVFSVCLLLAGCGSKEAPPYTVLPTPEPALLTTPEPSLTPAVTRSPKSEPTPLPTPLPKKFYPTEKDLLAGVEQADLFGFLPDDYGELYSQYYPNGTAEYNGEFLSWYKEELENDRAFHLKSGSLAEFEPFFITVPYDLNNDGYDDYLTFWESGFLYCSRYTTTMTILLSDENGGYTEAARLSGVVLPNPYRSTGGEGRNATRFDILSETINGVNILRLTDEVWHEEFYGEAYTGIPNYLYGFRYTYFYYNTAQKGFLSCSPAGSDLEVIQELALSVIKS